jgi:probable HAF family extracellular repeat protein
LNDVVSLSRLQATASAFRRTRPDRGRRPRRQQRPRFIPRLEPLEDRCLLSYSVTDLGTLGGTNSLAFGINASGKVVGYAYLPGDGAYHPFLYDGTATPPMQDLGTLGGTVGFALGINSSNQIAGWASRSDYPVNHAFLYDGTATPPMQDLGTLGGPQSWASGINDSGQLVGGANIPGIAGEWPFHAFLYDATATPPMQDLGTLGGTDSWANGINSSSQVVGAATTTLDDSSYHAFLYDATATPPMQDLGTLAGWDSEAMAINNSSQVVGYANSLFAPRAFLYDRTAIPPIQDLGTLGGTNSLAWSINNSSQVVGWANTTDGNTHAFLYVGTAAPPMQDLNGLIPPGSGWVLQVATGINDSGQIVGFGLHDGATRAFLLTPAPSPSMPHGAIGLAATAAASVRVEGITSLLLQANAPSGVSFLPSSVGDESILSLPVPVNAPNRMSFNPAGFLTTPPSGRAAGLVRAATGSLAEAAHRSGRDQIVLWGHGLSMELETEDPAFAGLAHTSALSTLELRVP